VGQVAVGDWGRERERGRRMRGARRGRCMVGLWEVGGLF